MRSAVAALASSLLLAALSGIIHAADEVNKIPPLEADAPVVHWEKPPNDLVSQDSNMEGCSKPRETATFRNCKSVTGVFPSYAATCECVQCALALRLVCHHQGKWFATAGLDVCDPSKTPQCGKCSVSDLPPTVTCNEKKNGFLAESRKCSCKSNCKEVSFLCDKSTKWKTNYPQKCQDTLPTKAFTKSLSLHTSYASGTFTYACKEGFALQGPRVLQCTHGKLNGTQPKCILPPVTKPTVPVTTSSTTPKIVATTPAVLPPTSASTPEESTTASISTLASVPTTGSETEPDQQLQDSSSPPSLEFSPPEEEETSSERSQDVESDSSYGRSDTDKSDKNKKPSSNKKSDVIPKKFPITLILIAIFIILVIVLAGLGLFLLSRHYMFICECGRRSFSSKTGYSIKPNELVI